MIIAQRMIKKKGISATFDKAREVARKYTYQLRKQGKLSFSDPTAGDVPSVHLVRRTIPEAWEDVIMALMGIGQTVHTGYDPRDAQGEYTSFPSMEATVMMHITEPFGEPRFHKHYLGGWKGFGDYKAEIEGVKDHWMISPEIVVDLMKKKKFDEIKSDTRWKYTYSQRLRNYPYLDIEGNPQTINQLASVVRKLTKEPLSKSAQGVTWDPRWDHNDGQMDVAWHDYDSPCLQRFWFRLIPFENGYRMNVNSDWRSRDHLKAVPQNIFGVTEGMHEPVRLQLQEALGKPVARGRYVDKSDSLHLYGHYLDTRKQGLDAEAYFQDIFRVAAGQPISERLIFPETDMFDIAQEEIQQEYQFRKDNPSFGMPEKK